MQETTEQFFWKGKNLDEYRQIMDKPADDAISSVIDKESLDHLRGILKGMAENDSSVSDELPSPMHDFVQTELDMEFTPEDIELFNQAHEIWKDKGMNFVFVLFFRSLPLSYMAEKPAHVLRITKLIERHTERRIFETAQFVFDVMDKNWWEDNERGILTAMKVRIMHAAMRHIILDSDKKGEKWNMEWGLPISQEDLVATNQVFSLEFFKGMELLGDELTPDEQKAWFHTWKTIGKIMGVQDDLISKDVNEAWELQHSVYNHLFRDKTESGVVLLKALVETMEHFHLHTKLVLQILRKMMADEQFPDCFERLLGPSYGEDPEFSDLFKVFETDEEKEDHERALRADFRRNIGTYFETLRGHKKKYLKSKPKEGILDRIIDWVFDLLGLNHSYLDQHLEQIKSIIHEKGEDIIDEIEEKLIIKSLSAISKVMITILSLHFRTGKSSGFRIPKDLNENWSYKG